MRFLKIVVIPLVIVGLGLIITIAVYSDLPYSEKIMLAPLLAELSILLYFWKFHLTKKTKSGLFHIYMTFLVMLVFVVKIIATYLYSNGTIPWTPYSYIYFTFVGIVFIAGVILKVLYGGTNSAIGMQYKGETNLATMRALCKEITHVLNQNKLEATKAIKGLRQLEDAIEYSDPVSHKKVIPIEKTIIDKLEKTLIYAKNKHFGKIREVIKGSNGVLHLLEERNNRLRQYK